MNLETSSCPYVVGLTGGIGSGKTTASNYLQTFGVQLIDADQVARQVVTPESSALQAIATRFGNRIVQADGHLNRPLLRSIIFKHEPHKHWLEGLLHPLIRETIQTLLSRCDNRTYVVLVSPLLFETGQHRLTDRSLLIDCPEAMQLQRALRRDSKSPSDIQRIMAQQFTREQRLEQADDTVLNDTSQAHLYSQLKELHQKYTQLNLGRHGE